MSCQLRKKKKKKRKVKHLFMDTASVRCPMTTGHKPYWIRVAYPTHSVTLAPRQKPYHLFIMFY